MKPFSFALAALLTLAPLVSYSQSQRELFRPPPERRSDRINIGYRGMFGTDVEFSNVGNVALPVIQSENGDFIVRNYDDGHVGMDSTYTEANGYTSDGKTAYFSYSNHERQYDPTTNTLNYNAYSSEGASRSFTEDSGMATGWELQYTRFFGKKQRFGWMFGFSFNSFNVSNNSNTFADLRVITDHYQLDGSSALPPAPYMGGLTRDAKNSDEVVVPRPLMPLNPTSSTETFLPGEAVVVGQYQLRSAFFTFRTGPLYQLQFGKKFSIEIGAGVTGMFFSGEYSVFETVYPKWQLNPAGDPVVVESTHGLRNIFKATERDGEWLVGIYADVTANYQWTDRVNIFGGVEYQALGNFTGTDGVSSRTVEVDMGGNAYARAGLGIKF